VGVSPTFCFSGRILGVTGARTDHLVEVRSIADRVARSHGLELFDLQLRRESIGWMLRIFIDRPMPSGAGEDAREESVTVADCAAVSVDVSAILDAEVTFDHAYTLEVSSPGLDRPLRHLADFARFVGRQVRVVTSEPVDGLRFVSGRITGVDGETIVIADGKTTRRVPATAVARARLEVEF
jgi:ribosome maturation factor RimP